MRLAAAHAQRVEGRQARGLRERAVGDAGRVHRIGRGEAELARQLLVQLEQAVDFGRLGLRRTVEPAPQRGAGTGHVGLGGDALELALDLLALGRVVVAQVDPRRRVVGHHVALRATLDRAHVQENAAAVVGE
ncbi:MAG TPA: hypothetical protein VMR31_07100 [Myxococcota bacterium]|nr:hypothetical protein [Myxococcota bacterium]